MAAFDFGAFGPTPIVLGEPVCLYVQHALRFQHKCAYWLVFVSLSVKINKMPSTRTSTVCMLPATIVRRTTTTRLGPVTWICVKRCRKDKTARRALA